MASPKVRGRMIRKSISESRGFASLSPEAGVLFLMLIPHFNGHGKMQAGPGIVKDDVVPLIEYLSYENLTTYLREISDKTNVKWFFFGTKWWLHSLHFLTEHQDLREDKLGIDDLPSFPNVDIAISPVLSPVLSPYLVQDSPSRAEGFKVLRSKENQEGQKQVQDLNQDLNQDSIGGGVDNSPPKGSVDSSSPLVSMEEEVERIKGLHLATCGLASVPPLGVIREVLNRHGPGKIDDVYQAHGGDQPRWRQRNIVESLTQIRDGVARDPPKTRALLKKSKSEQVVEQSCDAARRFVERINRKEKPG